ncbi:carbohydrate-binding protein [Paenibacillus mucilaginosus]|uniref:XynD2 n=1 Tax=Paenibacillus mucilaginosus (strain KNP414) TaxID=1036673 RepID=F8F6K9_PAEMK|nr:carbohydrate-binding protein [Paenibacillus mucilaginosus]AEI42963.1 XynD2 [Paenibacillus mucilaginosus KNP414]MCG7216074.1 carbohydrate-binding protein [Paenibacillus mucilaginosus]WDM24593.1 carbohydrate-binding protein [Paenibacillus mucilaginosus]
MNRKVISGLVAGSLLVTPTFIDTGSKAEAAVIQSIPNTTKVEKSYESGFLSVPGYASLGVKDRSSYIGTPYYRTVSNGREFLQAILDAGTGTVKVIEVKEDINLGWTELALDSTERSKYSFVSRYPNPSNGFTNPLLIASGVSKVNISNVDGLTIFSTSGKTIRHAEIKLQASANDIVIRNLKFDEMWQWDDSGQHKEVGWSYIKVNGANNVWIDHCKFTIAADGMIDMENGASNVTLSWNEFGLAAETEPSVTSSVYQSISFMEQKYAAGTLNPSSSVYYKMRNDGATPNQIMAYAAYHSKVHLAGSGDKDYTNYISPAGVEVKDGNQRIRLTMAYNSYTNVGQRLPMIRQGTGHIYNNYFDNSTHQHAIDSVAAISKYGGDKLSRGINARNGASIAGDTNVYNAFNEPIIGAERQGDDTGNMSLPFSELFKDAMNHSLLVNSKVTNSSGTYIGSSWDNNGVNAFTKGFTWYDKSTIGKWAWSSHIDGVENMSKTNPPSTPFTFTYGYNEKLPYAYKTVPLASVVPTVKKYAGVTKLNFSAADWLRTNYIDAYSTIQAESHSSMSGVAIQTGSAGSPFVGDIQNGDYIVFQNVHFGTSTPKLLEARVAPEAGGSMEVRLDSLTGPLAGTCKVSDTDSSQTWETKSCSVSGVSVTNDVYLKFTGSSGSLFNIDWFKFK